MAKPKPISTRRYSGEIDKLQRLYEESKIVVRQSNVVPQITAIAKRIAIRGVIKAVSLGLGSLVGRDQSRRMKQLALFMAFVKAHNSIAANSITEVYAQDPAFTKTDEKFLQSLGIVILHTPDSSQLGEALTLVYTPFLTIQAYKALFQTVSVSYLVGDDFHVLREKWSRNSENGAIVEQILRQTRSKLNRRVLDCDGIWDANDKAFPMAAYLARKGARDESAAVTTPGLQYNSKADLLR